MKCRLCFVRSTEICLCFVRSTESCLCFVRGTESRLCFVLSLLLSYFKRAQSYDFFAE